MTDCGLFDISESRDEASNIITSGLDILEWIELHVGFGFIEGSIVGLEKVRFLSFVGVYLLGVVVTHISAVP